MSRYMFTDVKIMWGKCEPIESQSDPALMISTGQHSATTVVVRPKASEERGGA